MRRDHPPRRPRSCRGEPGRAGRTGRVAGHRGRTRGRIIARECDRLTQLLLASALPGPDERLEPRHVVGVGQVHRLQVQSRPPRHLQSGVREWSVRTRRTPEDRRCRRRLTRRDPVGAVVIAVAIDQQAQSGRRADLDQGQRWGKHGQHREQRRAPGRIVGLGAGADGGRDRRVVQRRYGAPFEPATAAALEVEWWHVHRENQRPSAPGDDHELAAALGRLYSQVYGMAPAQVGRAAEQRAHAMPLSDQWIREGRHLDSPLIEQERLALIRSYTALLGAIRVDPAAPPAPPGERAPNSGNTPVDDFSTASRRSLRILSYTRGALVKKAEGRSIVERVDDLVTAPPEGERLLPGLRRQFVNLVPPRVGS